MKIYLKYLVLIFGIIAGISAIKDKSMAAGITCAGCVIAFAIIEVQDVRILNEEQD